MSGNTRSNKKSDARNSALWNGVDTEDEEWEELVPARFKRVCNQFEQFEAFSRSDKDWY